MDEMIYQFDNQNKSHFPSWGELHGITWEITLVQKIWLKTSTVKSHWKGGQRREVKVMEKGEFRWETYSIGMLYLGGVAIFGSRKKFILWESEDKCITKISMTANSLNFSLSDGKLLKRYWSVSITQLLWM